MRPGGAIINMCTQLCVVLGTVRYSGVLALTVQCAACATIHNDYFRQHAIIDKHIQSPHRARRPAQTVTATVSFSLCRRIGWLACCSQYVCRWYLGLFDTYETEA